MVVLSDETKTLLIVGAVLLLLYFVYSHDDEPVSNDGEVSLSASPSEATNVNINMQAQKPAKRVSFDDSANGLDGESNESQMPALETVNLNKKFDSKNKAHGGYKTVNYANGDRGNIGPNEWEDYFNENNNFIRDSQAELNAGFAPMDEDMNNLGYESRGAYKQKAPRKKESPEELFDADKLLPKEERSDWFD